MLKMMPLLLAVGLAPTAFAALISPVTVSSTMGQFNSNFALVSISNGSGLSSLSLTATHARTTGAGQNPAIAWVSPGGVNTGDLIFNLGGLYTLSGSSIWNFNNDATDTATVAVRSIQMALSIDGSNFGPLLSLSVNGGLSGTTGNLTVPPNGGVLALNPDLITFAAANATHVRLTVSGLGAANVGTGLSEVAFDGVSASSAVPEPSSFVLFGLGAAGLAIARRVRR
jgi:hypothetical protein